MSDSRFPRWVFGAGTEPDPRFTLANERTFLAWTRTALALIAGGVALDAIEVPLPAGIKLAAVVILLGLGLLLPISAWAGWAVAERAMRHGRPLPASLPTLLVVAGIVAVTALILTGIALR
jgi:putative membrane protein